MTDDAREQIKADCERDEARSRTTCFWDALPGTVLINGVYFCESHAMCSTCLAPLAQVKTLITCPCHKYGYLGHEELIWCSMECLEASHPDVDIQND